MGQNLECLSLTGFTENTGRSKDFFLFYNINKGFCFDFLAFSADSARDNVLIWVSKVKFLKTKYV